MGAGAMAATTFAEKADITIACGDRISLHRDQRLRVAAGRRTGSQRRAVEHTDRARGNLDHQRREQQHPAAFMATQALKKAGHETDHDADGR
jgi:hypothetical protein